MTQNNYEFLKYRPPGEVARAFHKDDSFVRGLLGPVGSGKSSSCCVEIVMKAFKQAPSPDGIRRSRWLVIRNTYPELKSTTIKTWEQWFPPNLCKIKWDVPITATMKFPDVGDGTGMELEVIFMALDRPEETGKLRSLELTGAWLNEASELPKEVLDMVTQRVGRYPSKRQGGPSWTGIIMDTNPPDDDSWWYKFAEEGTPQGWAFYRQPGGLMLFPEGSEGIPELGTVVPGVGTYCPNPMAENVFNLPNGYTYYLNQVAGKAFDWINIFLLANYGTTADGKPVYPEYNDKVHVAKEPLKKIEGTPIILGWDFGLTPACIIAQMSPRGQLMILEELVSEDMGIRQFATDIVKPVLMNKYSGHRIESVGDPAGINRSQTDERTCFQELLEAGIPSEPAETNDFIPRRESVAYFMTKMADGNPAFLLDPSCKMLRKGFMGRYRYERLKTSGATRYKDRPVKDDSSHPQDALQYLCLKLRGVTRSYRARTVVNKSSKGWT